MLMNFSLTSLKRVNMGTYPWAVLYSPSIFLTSSQTAPVPQVVLMLVQDSNLQRKALYLIDLTEKLRNVNDPFGTFITCMLQVKIKFRLKFFNLG